ncbi:MAG: hypothetical protein SVW02_00080 [Candidatus Nanohaloarchaea archaeon]|nr:hypothetical protein [Candidatus Nanohaloarchaea archaeon]
MSVDDAAYAAAIREAARDGAALDTFREPLTDEQFVDFAAPIGMAVSHEHEIAEAAETHPGLYASDGYIAVRTEDDVLCTYDREAREFTVDGAVFYSAVPHEPAGLMDRVYDRIVGEGNPLYQQGRDTAVAQDLEDGVGQWVARSRRLAYGQTGLTAAAAVSGLYGIVSGDISFLQLGAGIGVTAAAAMPTYGAYVRGGLAGMKEQAAGRQADDLEAVAGDVTVHADMSPVLEDWLDAFDPAAETPDWLSR